jgi:autotransporter-associated beta strand protein
VCHKRIAALTAAIFFAAGTSVQAQLDPNAFLPIGTLTMVGGGPVTINTDALTLTEGGFTFTGVALNQAQGPQIGVFDFRSINIPSGSTISVTGSRPLAILSQSDATIFADIVVSSNGFTAAGPGGYLGASATSPDPANKVLDAHTGLGPGGGYVLGHGAGGGGNGGPGGQPTGGPSNGGLPQLLIGGSGGAATSTSGLTNTGGAGSGAVEIVADGTLSLLTVAANGAGGSGGTNGNAGGGAGGSILLSGRSLGVFAVTANGGNGAGAEVQGTAGGSGGGGGRVMLSGVGSYSLGSTDVNSGKSVAVNGGTGSNAGNGFVGVITVDALTTVVPNGFSVPLNGTPVHFANGGTQATVEAYVRRSLTINAGGTATLGMDNALQGRDGSGNPFTVLTVDGTFNMNGYSQAVTILASATTSTGATVNIPATSTLTASAGGYYGQLTGSGAVVVKTLTGDTEAFNGASPSFTGSTSVAAGTLSLGNDMALPNATVMLAGGILTFATANPVLGGLAGTGSLSFSGVTSLTVGGNNASTTYSGALSGSPALSKIGTGTLTLAGSSPNFTGATTVTAGTLAVVNDTALQFSTVNLPGGGVVQFVPGAVNPTFGALGGSGNVTANTVSSLTVGGNGASTTYTGLIQGPTNFVKAGAGTLTIGNDQALSNDTLTVNGGSINFTSPAANPSIGALAGTGGVSLSGLNSLIVGVSNASTTYAGNFSGSIPGGIIKNGTGTWTIASPDNAQSGPFMINRGTVVVGSTGALSSANAITVGLGTLDVNGFDLGVFSLTVGGTVLLGGGSLTALNPVTVQGSIANGSLRSGPYNVTASGATLNAITTYPATIVNVNATGNLKNFTNGGTVNVAAGLPHALFNGFTNQGGGTVALGAGSKINVQEFQSSGVLSLAPGSSSSAPTQLTGAFTAPLYFNGGSRTILGTPQTATQNGQPTFLAGIDLFGANAVVAGGLFVNNGYVEDSSNNFQGTATVVADFGSLVKGAGFFQNTVVTQNGGKFQAGNSPGAANFGGFVLGPGGVSSYLFAIDDATGAAGPSPDAAGHVSGWSLVKSVRQAIVGAMTSGDFTWTATAADKLTVSIETLVNPTTVGVDVAGPMADFDPTRSYSWPAFEWSGTYSGPTDSTILTASTQFDTSGFHNPVAGVFGWSFDGANGSLSLTYTPTAVPEPGTLCMTALGAVAASWIVRRRQVAGQVNGRLPVAA